MKLTKNRATGLLALLLILALSVASLAYFTDRVQSTATAKAGTLDLELTQTWATDNATAISHFAPGDILDLKYTLKNNSTLAAKVREKFVVTSDKEIPADTFRIYKLSDLQKDADTGFWAPKSGKVPIPVFTDTAYADGIMYTTYKLPQFVLDGTHASETNKATATPNTDMNSDKKVYANTSDADHYVLLFNKTAANTVAGANIGVEYLAEALQNNGTNSATSENAALWTTVADENITFMTGVAKAVPQLTFDPQNP